MSDVSDLVPSGFELLPEGLAEALAVRPTDAIDVVLGGNPVGEAVIISFEWPNADGTGVDSFYAEPPIDWPQAVRSEDGLVALIPSLARPLSIEQWFYVDRDSQGVPIGEPAHSEFCGGGVLDSCGVYDAVEGVLSVPILSADQGGLLVVQVEWPTIPAAGFGALVARVSWAVELAA